MEKLFSLFLMTTLCISLTSCGGSSSSSSSSGGAAQATGISTGGTGGGAGTGGAGGSYTVFLHDDSAGDIVIKTTGTVDTSFTMPDMSGFDTGANPLEVTADTTVVVDPANEPSAGLPYMLTGDTTIYISDGDDDTSTHTTVTGIEVSTGMTLTFETNTSPSKCGRTLDTAEINISNDIANYGTITVVDMNDSQRGSLFINSADNYYGFSDSRIDTRGTKDGQHGGYIKIFNDTSSYNLGNVYSNGADSSAGDGGDGGFICFSNELNPGVVYNKGNLYAFGGDSETGNGGSGNTFWFWTWGAPSNLSNSGDYFGYGGDGYINGGNGGGKVGSCNGTTDIGSGEGGSATVSGNMDIHGGNGETGTGGSVQSISIWACGDGDLLASGTYNMRGGDALGADRDAGNGGLLLIYSQNIRGTTTTGSLETSVSYDNSGGNANTDEASTGNGGAAGAVIIKVRDARADQHLTIITSRITTDGGDGGTGGNGGVVNIYATGGTGSIDNSVAISTVGGNATGTANDGGNGGLVSIYPLGGNTGSINNNSTIDTSGGDSAGSNTNLAGVGGNVNISAGLDATVTGNITTDGGHDLNGGDANNAGNIEINSGNDVTVYSIINASGGDGGTSGGDSAANIQILTTSGGTVDVTGSITANGGSASAGTTGGDSACITIFNETVPVTGGATGPGVADVNIFGGTGTAGDGMDGEYYVDDAYITGDGTGQCSGLGEPPHNT